MNVNITPKLLTDSNTFSEKNVLKNERKSSKTSKVFLNKTVQHPVAGQTYVFLGNGRVVPIKTVGTSVPSSAEVKNVSILKTSSFQPSCSQLNNETINLPSKVAQPQPILPKPMIPKSVITNYKTLNSKMHKIKNSSGECERRNIEVVRANAIRTQYKHKAENESTLASRKKHKTKIDDYIPTFTQTNEDDTGGQADSGSSDSSVGCTTPEYIYDTLDDVDDETSALDQSQDVDYDLSENLNHDEIYDRDREEHQTLHQVSVNSSVNKVTTTTTTKANIQINQASNLNLAPNIRLDSKEKVNNQSPIVKKSTSLRPNNHNVTLKSSKVHDRFPDLVIPSNIDQYGDCLKTRLGRYHYGLTLNDPPCQFFQGVLKGSSGQTLATMFGDINLISKFEGVSLNEIGHFMIDTTFRVVPSSTDGINHVMTISIIFQNQIIPLWYAITSCSSPELYKRIIIEFQQHVLDWPFKSVLVDNDPALCKALRAVFPDVELYGSWFHYCYSIWKLLSANDLVEESKSESSTLLSAVKMLMVLPYLPPITQNASSFTMLDGFEMVKQFAQENNLPQEFNNVLNFVAKFWFNTVKSENFTVFGKQTCSLNYVEIIQLSLLSYLKPDGNIWTLTYSFQSVAKSTNCEFTRYLNGKPPLVKRNRGKKFYVLIRQNMKKLMMGTMDIKTYLEKSVMYCDEILDIFLHPLYHCSTSGQSHFVHSQGWKIKICSD